MTAFKLDENLPEDAAVLQKSHGHDAATVLDQSLGGASDAEVSRVCEAEGRALVTLDLDFANFLVFPLAQHAGLVALRLPEQSIHGICRAIATLVDLCAREPLAGKLWIIEPHGVRVRDH